MIIPLESQNDFRSLYNSEIPYDFYLHLTQPLLVSFVEKGTLIFILKCDEERNQQNPLIRKGEKQNKVSPRVNE